MTYCCCIVLLTFTNIIADTFTNLDNLIVCFGKNKTELVYNRYNSHYR